MSTHLAILARTKLIVGERSIIHRANLGRFREVTLFRLKDCCGGRADLCAPLIASGAMVLRQDTIADLP